MCDFHSVIVKGDGRILHLACNSHSVIATEHKLDMGENAKWWECEWDGIGPIPNKLVQNRRPNYHCEPTQAAYRAAGNHYTKLSKVLNGELSADDTFPFDQPEYSDVRAKVAEAKRKQLFAEMLRSSYEPAEFLAEMAESLNLTARDIFLSEMEDEFTAGQEYAAESLYDQEYVYNEVETAIEKTQESAYSEGYTAGFLAGKIGQCAEVLYIDNMPSFLF